MEINGVIMDHDDSLDDRTKGADLDRNFQATVQLWRKEYDEEYIVPGGMYRGEPPEDFFSSEYINVNSNVPVPAPREPFDITVATPAAPNPPTPNSWMSMDELGAFLQGQSNENPMIWGYVSCCVSFLVSFVRFRFLPPSDSDPTSTLYLSYHLHRFSGKVCEAMGIIIYKQENRMMSF